jgi:hypothetical protein
VAGLFFEDDFFSVEGYGSRANGDSGVKAGAPRFNLRGRPGLDLSIAGLVVALLG